MSDIENEVETETTTDPDNSIWHRGFYMLLFALFYSVAEVVMVVVVVVQFGYCLLKEEEHPRLLSLGASLSTYIYQLLRFVTFNSEEKPYPFSEWPTGNGEE